MVAEAEDDDARHRREEHERRAKRKASKFSKSESQKEKDRQRREYRQKILQQHGAAAGKSITSMKEKKKVENSQFQQLFTQRAQGFQIDFRFRNAPPRPPVGPTFVGHTLESALADHCRQYKPLNAVEINYTWKLHTEPDLGVPLGPAAMDVSAYTNVTEMENVVVPQEDLALLEWKGSLGDTAAAARKKKLHSRVLKEEMQTWMKRTTYLSNDYTRKVHDFRSLAKTKQELAAELAAKQEEMAQRRSAHAIERSFHSETTKKLQHPTKKNLQPKRVLSVLPNVEEWGKTFTHVIIDKEPAVPDVGALAKALIADVEKPDANARMTCTILAPDGEEVQFYRQVHAFDLDVIPLKQEDIPHINFCLWACEDKASYIPIASRVQLSTGRPSNRNLKRPLERRPLSETEITGIEERCAEIDQDLAEKRHIEKRIRTLPPSTAAFDDDDKKKPDDGEDEDFGDSDDDEESEEELFESSSKKIVAAQS